MAIHISDVMVGKSPEVYLPNNANDTKAWRQEEREQSFCRGNAPARDGSERSSVIGTYVHILCVVCRFDFLSLVLYKVLFKQNKRFKEVTH